MAAWRGARVVVDWQPRVPGVLVRTVMAAWLGPTPVPGTVVRHGSPGAGGFLGLSLGEEAVHAPS